MCIVEKNVYIILHMINIQKYLITKEKKSKIRLGTDERIEAYSPNRYILRLEKLLHKTM